MDGNALDPKTLKMSILAAPKQKSDSEAPKQPFHTTAWRWLALLLMNLLLLGDYVVIDSPQALETQLKVALDLTTQEYSYLYSSWALPSIFIPFIGGYLTDYLGVRPTLVLSCTLLTIGQVIYYFGAHVLSFGWMLAGRSVYAVGSNPLNVAQIVIIYKWFQGREVALAMAVSSMTSCVGRALNSFLIPKLFEISQTIDFPILFGLLTCVFSTCVCIVVVIWDKINDKRIAPASPDASASRESEIPEKISLKDIKYFGFAVWLLVINFGLTDGAFFSFNAFSNDFYHIRYKFSNSSAGNIISVNYLIGSISSVVFEILIDKKGYRASIIFYNSIFGILGMLYFFIFPTCPECWSTVIPQVLFGLLIGINDAATFPSLPLILEEKYLGTGYGLFFVIQNFLIFVLPPIAAYIIDLTSAVQSGYFWMLVFFFGLAVLTTFESFALLMQDRKRGRILDTYIVSEDQEDEAALLAGMESHSDKEDNKA